MSPSMHIMLIAEFVHRSYFHLYSRAFCFFSSQFSLCNSLRRCLYGGKPVLLVWKPLVSGLNFTLLLHGNFLTLLGGLYLSAHKYINFFPTLQRGPAHSECVNTENFKPFSDINKTQFSEDFTLGNFYFACSHPWILRNALSTRISHYLEMETAENVCVWTDSH